MKKIIKTSLDLSSIALINRTNCDGVEIQLLNRKNDFNLLASIKKPITSIHIDLYSSKKEVNQELELDLRSLLINDFDYFKKVCEIANTHHSAVVVHAVISYINLDIMNSEFKNAIRELDRLFPNLKICLENTGEMSYTARKDVYVRAEELPKVVEYVNQFSEHKIFYPLLDICHYYEEFSQEVWNAPKPLATIIDAYKSNYQLLHFNYGIGDCSGKRHSINYDTNKKLLHNILDALTHINKDAYLILEIVEDDYEHRPNMLKLLEDINEWEKVNEI